VDVDELAAKAATGQLWRLHFVVDELEDAVFERVGEEPGNVGQLWRLHFVADELEDAVFEGVGENPVDVVWIASWRLPRSVKETEKL
jgi:hypothetical protein